MPWLAGPAVTLNGLPSDPSAHVAPVFRQIDPVIVKGEALPGFPGEAAESLRLFAVQQGALVAVPFQVDPLNTDGDYIFSENDAGPDRDGMKLFLGQDELVFMARDLGDRLGDETPRPWDEQAGLQRGAEIEVTDPMTGDRGWVYLFAFSAPPALSPVDYVSYRADEDLVCSPSYDLAFKNPEIRTSLNYLAFRGEDGSRIDLVDRFKARAEATFLWGKVRIRKTEGNFWSKVLAIRDGPCARGPQGPLRASAHVEDPHARCRGLHLFLPQRYRTAHTTQRTL